MFGINILTHDIGVCNCVQWKQCQTLFCGAPKSLHKVIAAMKLKDAPCKESYDQPRHT